MTMDPFGGVPVQPAAPVSHAQTLTPPPMPPQPGQPPAQVTPPPSVPATPAPAAAPAASVGGFAAVVPDVTGAASASGGQAGPATTDAPLPGFGPAVPGQSAPAAQQPPEPAPAPAASASPASARGVWHVGQPVIAEAGSMPNPAPYVESRKPVKLPDGTEVTSVPGEPVYTMPGEIREYQPDRDSYGRYLHVHPHFGYRTAFSRATTIAKKLDSGSNLMDWRDRKLIEGLARYPQLLNGLDVGKMGTTNEYKLRDTLKQIAENATNAAGAADGREFGTALHAWTEAVDHGKTTYDEVPGEFKPFVASYLQALSRHGIEVIPEYVERIMYNPIVNTMGTIDRIYRLPTGELVIGDIKTSGNIDYAWTSIALQMAQYANASYLLSEDGTTWEPMPAVRIDIAVIAGIPHTPKDRGPHCDMHIVNVEYGTQLLYLARDIAHVQSKAKQVIPMSHSAQPGNADEAMEWVTSGMPSLSTPGANPLSQLEGLASESAQAALDAMDGDVGRYAQTAVAGEIVSLMSSAGSDSARLQYLSELASVLAGAARAGVAGELAGLASALGNVDPEGITSLAVALDAVSASAGIRASRAKTRDETNQAEAEAEKSREVKAQRASAVSAAAAAAVGGATPPPPVSGQAPAAIPAAPTFGQVPSFSGDADSAPAPAVQTETVEKPVSRDEPRIAGVRESVRQAIYAAYDPEDVAGLYEPDWSEEEVAVAREHMDQLSAALADAVRSQIDGALSREAITNLWESWWPQELVDYAARRIEQLPPF